MSAYTDLLVYSILSKSNNVIKKFNFIFQYLSKMFDILIHVQQKH